MKQLKEYTASGEIVSSVDIPLRRIEKLPLPYTGNKKKLIYHIYNAINKYGIKFDSVLDAFSGSATVSYLFKIMGKRVISNDLLTSSYLNSVAFVENPGIKLSDEDKKFLIHHKNSNKNTFVQDNYLGGSETSRFNKFTLKECQYLDNFRANIDELCDIYTQGIGLVSNAAIVMRLPFGNVDQSTDILNHRKKQENNYGKNSDQHDRRIGIYYDQDFNLKFDKWFKKYVNDFNSGVNISDDYEMKFKRASFLANLQQHVLRDCMVQGRLHQGQALAEVNTRLKHPKNQLKAHYSNNGSTEMDFITQKGAGWEYCLPGQGMKWWTFADVEFKGKCISTNTDVTNILNICNVDCVYFDPPYGGQSSDYATIYRFFEEYIYSTKMEDLPHIRNAHKFVSKKHYEKYFVEMLNAAKHIPIWMFSYNDRSWKNIDDIVDLIKTYKRDVKVEILDSKYRYLYRKNQGRSDRSSEYFIIARNDF